MAKSWIDRLPDVRGFTRLTQSLAALDAVLSPDWEYRYYSFNAAWSDGEMMASMRDGCGDLWFAWISSVGVALHGLAHESATFEPGEPKPWVFKVSVRRQALCPRMGCQPEGRELATPERLSPWASWTRTSGPSAPAAVRRSAWQGTC